MIMLLHVPLQRIDIRVAVLGFVASVESDLYYFNDSGDVVETEFVFPLDTDSAVYKFEAEIDDRTIVAEVQEKSQAKETYKAALRSQYVAIYMAEDDDFGDVFRLKLGNLPGGKSAKLTFAYTKEIDMEAEDVGIFTLPTLLSPRFVPNCQPGVLKSLDEASGGAAPKILPSLSDNGILYTEDLIMNFEVTVTGGGNASHSPSKTTMDVQADAISSSTRMHSRRLRFGTDFVLELHYKGFKTPCTILEKGKSDGYLSSDVLMVNFTPTFREFQTDTSHEFVFLIDRSGSMSGRIKKARETLLLLLKSLPVGCTFNVVSFGSEFSTLFPKSKTYSEESLKEAMKLQQRMSADMGGTEIYQALTKVFEDKSAKTSRQVFLLTDGQVSNVADIVHLVREQSNSRVFTFGIGDGCSTALIRDVARAGRGIATFVKDTDRLQTKVMSVMKNSLYPAVTDVSLTWSLPEGCAVVSISREMPVIFHENRLILYGVISGEIPQDTPVACALKLTGFCGDKAVEYGIEVDLNSDNSKDDKMFLLHRLAAKARLSELEMMDNGDTSLMTALSVAVNIPCRETAFVGINKTSKEIFAAVHSKKESNVERNVIRLRLHKSGLDADEFGKDQGVRSPKHFENPFKKLNETFKGIFKRKKNKEEEMARKESHPKLSGKRNTSPKEKTLTVMMKLIEMQKFDGSWELTKDFALLLNKPLETLKTLSAVKNLDVWATGLAIAYLRRECSKKKKEWELIAEKALKWLEDMDQEGKDVLSLADSVFEQ